MKKQKNENVSYLSEVLDKLKEHKMAMAGLVVLIVEILMVVFLPMITFHLVRPLDLAVRM